MHALIVENDPDVLEVICAVLADSGIAAIGTSDPLHACRQIASAWFDVVLSDVLFPGPLSGFDVADAAAANGIRCVLTSGHAEVVAKALKRGVDVLAKPFSTGRLLDAIGTGAVLLAA